jgi:hypothetical protein
MLMTKICQHLAKRQLKFFIYGYEVDRLLL